MDHSRRGLAQPFAFVRSFPPSPRSDRKQLSITSVYSAGSPHPRTLGSVVANTTATAMPNPRVRVPSWLRANRPRHIPDDLSKLHQRIRQHIIPLHDDRFLIACPRQVLSDADQRGSIGGRTRRGAPKQTVLRTHSLAEAVANGLNGWN
jgi:hypothetical protein